MALSRPSAAFPVCFRIDGFGCMVLPDEFLLVGIVASTGVPLALTLERNLSRISSSGLTKGS